MPKTTPAPVPVPQPIHPPIHHQSTTQPFWKNFHHQATYRTNVHRVEQPEPKPARVEHNPNSVAYRTSYVYSARPIPFPKITTERPIRPKKCSSKNKEKCKRKGKGKKKNRKGSKSQPSNNTEDNNIQTNVHSGAHWSWGKVPPIKCEPGFRVTNGQQCEGK